MAAALAVWLASPLVFFMYVWGGWAHPFAFCLGSAFLLVWQRSRGERSTGCWLVLGVLAGFLCLVRPAGGILMVFPLVEWPAGLKAVKAGRRLREFVLGPALGGVVSLVIFSPQLLLWKATSGSWLASPYKEVGDYHDWAHPDFLGLLFSTEQHGLFVWTPLLLLAAVGLPALWQRDRLFTLGSLVALVGTIYVYACWSIWWSGIGFSNRFLIGLTPLFVIGLGAGLDRLRRRIHFEWLFALLLLAVGWNLLLVGGYRANQIPQGIASPARVVDQPLTLAGLARTGLGLPMSSSSSRGWHDWVADGLVTERLADAIDFADLDVLGWVAAGLTFMGLLGWVLVSWLLSGSGRWTGRRQAAVVCGLGLAITLMAHLAIGLAGRGTAPRGHHYRFDQSFLVAQPYSEDVVLYSDFALPVSAVDVLSFLTYGHGVQQYTAVASVTVYDRAGHEVTRLLRAGLDTAETSYLRPEYRHTIRHTIERTVVVRDRPAHAYSAHRYDRLTFRAVVDLPTPMVVSKLRIRYLQPVGRLVVEDVFLRNF
jgi:hypothetical protein